MNTSDNELSPRLLFISDLTLPQTVQRWTAWEGRAPSPPAGGSHQLVEMETWKEKWHEHGMWKRMWQNHTQTKDTVFFGCCYQNSRRDDEQFQIGADTNIMCEQTFNMLIPESVTRSDVTLWWSGGQFRTSVTHKWNLYTFSPEPQWSCWDMMKKTTKSLLSMELCRQFLENIILHHVLFCCHW